MVVVEWLCSGIVQWFRVVCDGNGVDSIGNSTSQQHTLVQCH